MVLSPGVAGQPLAVHVVILTQSVIRASEFLTIDDQNCSAPDVMVIVPPG
jgi:hypothetical protein